jgi:hypothetical protein
MNINAPNSVPIINCPKCHENIKNTETVNQLFARSENGLVNFICDKCDMSFFLDEIQIRTIG